MLSKESPLLFPLIVLTYELLFVQTRQLVGKMLIFASFAAIA